LIFCILVFEKEKKMRSGPDQKVKVAADSVITVSTNGPAIESASL
jgi:hypothetical protein